MKSHADELAEATRNWVLGIASVLAVAVAVCLVVTVAYFASHRWHNGPDPQYLRNQMQLQQQCLTQHGNWSTPNSQEGRCVFH